MGYPFDQTLGWMATPPFGPAPAPAGPPINVAPFAPGPPPSVNGSFDLPPWESRPVPDLAGAVAAGANVAAQAQAVQPEQLPSEPAPGEIEFTPAETEADLRLTYPDSAGLVDPYPPGYVAPQPDSIGLVDPYPPRPRGHIGPIDPAALAADPAEAVASDTAFDAAVAGTQPIDPYGAAPFGAVPDGQTPDLAGKFRDFMVSRGAVADPTMGAETLDPYVGPADPNDPKALAQRAPLDPYDPGAISDRREAMAQAYANSTPEQRAEMDAREAALYATKRQTMEMQQAEADRKAVEDNARIAKEARAKAAADMAQLQADVQGMADSSPFESWWSDRSTGGKIAGVIGAIFSGLANPTGPNGAIDMMMKTADADAAQKWKKIEARRQLLGEQRAANQDDATEREKIRLASREQAIRMIEAQMNGLDPEGTQAINLGKTIVGLRAQDAQALQAYQAAQEKQALDIAAAESQRMQAEAQMLNARSLAFQRGMGRGAGGAGGAGGSGASTAGYGPKDKHTGKEWAAHYGYPAVDAEGKPVIQPPDGMTGKEADDWLNRQKEFGQSRNDAAREVNIKQGTRIEKQKFDLEREINDEGEPLYVYGADGKPLLNEFGDPQRIIANTPEEGKAMRAKVKNTKEAIRLLYEAKDIRRRMDAGDAKLPWTSASQRLGVISDALGPLVKEGTEGMSSDSDINRLVGGIGAKNLKSFIGQTAAIDQGIANATNLLNASLRTYHYNGPDIIVKDPFAGGPRRERVVDSATAELSSRGGTEPSLADKLIPDTSSVGGFLQSAVPFVGKPTRHKMTDAQKGAQQILLADIDRPDDPDAPDAIAGAFQAVTAGQNNEVRATTAAELWKRKQTDPRVAAYFNGLSAGEKAQFLSRLPKSQAWSAVFDMNDGAPDAAK